MSDITSKLRQFIEKFQGNNVSLYLILVNVLLLFFAIIFFAVGLLPFKNTGDFIFFAVLAFLFALYRPGWAFLFFIGAIALENINVAPIVLGISIRPYQLFGALTIFAFSYLFLKKKIGFSLPKFIWIDWMIFAFVVFSFLSSFSSNHRGASLKHSIILASFAVFYFLIRIYVQSFSDAKKIFPFFLSSSLVVMLYAIWQNIRFEKGLFSFEVMAGRPNATFTEADWLGMYLTLVIAVIYATIFYITKKYSEGRMFLAVSYLFLVLAYVALIITVSRSAWIGVAFITLVFLKIALTDGAWNFSVWQWKIFFKHLGLIVLALGLSLVIVYMFNLTRFGFLNRIQSATGLQKITVACQNSQNTPPEIIQNIEELSQYGCEHIDLEEIDEKEREGKIIREISRPDPNVNIRQEIYKKSLQTIKNNPVLGIGWGSIPVVLGEDEKGTAFNSSNIFLEVWLGSGIFGLLAFISVFGYIFVVSVKNILGNNGENKIAATFALLGFFAIIIPNLFNSGLFLGVFWLYLGISIALLSDLNKKK
ncbi:MAG: hypothetical protein ACD_11C00020G0013 [uncultured bacterium]|nr:MAG: hypothetical protein ACD_11C00020G0013 [uncultured bacterium]HBR71298.1 hypothetical protein [Candidatus Moranbacteria bacterium]